MHVLSFIQKKRVFTGGSCVVLQTYLLSVTRFETKLPVCAPLREYLKSKCQKSRKLAKSSTGSYKAFAVIGFHC